MGLAKLVSRGWATDGDDGANKIHYEGYNISFGLFYVTHSFGALDSASYLDPIRQTKVVKANCSLKEILKIIIVLFDVI